PVLLPIPGSASWDDREIVASFDLEDNCDEMIDADRLAPRDAADGATSLVVRAPGAGDRFDPLGMGGRTLSLNNFLRGRRVGRAERRRVPLVCDRAGIVWVVGHRIADRVRRTEATRRVLGLRREPKGSP